MYRTSDVSDKANFMSDGKLKIQYPTSDEGDDKTEIIPINYKKLEGQLHLTFKNGASVARESDYLILIVFP